MFECYVISESEYESIVNEVIEECAFAMSTDTGGGIVRVTSPLHQ